MLNHIGSKKENFIENSICPLTPSCSQTLATLDCMHALSTVDRVL